jgi:hypothetical protein
MRNDLVMRARDRIYHVDCFRCAVCERQLSSGDEFALTADDSLCCRADLDVVAASSSSGGRNSAKQSSDDAASIDDDVIARSDKVSGSAACGRTFNNNNDEVKTSNSGE